MIDESVTCVTLHKSHSVLSLKSVANTISLMIGDGVLNDTDLVVFFLDVKATAVGVTVVGGSGPNDAVALAMGSVLCHVRTFVM